MKFVQRSLNKTPILLATASVFLLKGILNESIKSFLNFFKNSQQWRVNTVSFPLSLFLPITERPFLAKKVILFEAK